MISLLCVATRTCEINGAINGVILANRTSEKVVEMAHLPKYWAMSMRGFYMLQTISIPHSVASIDRASSRSRTFAMLHCLYLLAALCFSLSMFDVGAQSLTGVQSRKIHTLGSATFDLPIATGIGILGPITFESRHVGTGHVLAFQFNSPIMLAGSATVVDTNAAAIGMANTALNMNNANEVLVTLSGIPDNKRVTVTLDNVNGVSNPFVVSLGFRLGDTNNSGTITGTDVSSVKARAGQAVNSTSARYDLNTSGVVTASDISAVKARIPVNLSPVVNAGTNQTITLPATAPLSGTASDDGLPTPPGALTLAWSRVSGPATVIFGNANALNTTASFTASGSYVLRLSASDGLLSTNANVNVTVNPGVAASFTVAGLTTPRVAGVSGNVTVTARDSFGNIATGYLGTVQFSSSDGMAALPANYAFTAGDAGVHAFAVTLNTVGTQSIAVNDTVSGAIVGSQTGITVNSAVLPGLFEKQHKWNTDVSALQADARSTNIINALIALGGWGNGDVLQTDRSIAILYADITTPRGTINAAPGYYLPDGDATPLQMPLPLNGNTEGNPGYACDRANDDCHVLVVERTEKKLYELYNATGTASGMIALGAFVWDLTKQYTPVLRGDQCTSADAAGLPMAALIPTADEVAAGDVPHALRFILPNLRMKAGVFVRPATHAGAPSSTNPNAPPYGVRFRLTASFDETPYNANARVILRAMKKYGMILSDGGDIALTFADDRLSIAKWATLGIINQTFNTIRVTDFEVVDLGAEIINTFNCVPAP